MSGATWGKVAYEAWMDVYYHLREPAIASPRVTVLPWDQLPPTEQDAWAAAAQAVRDAAAS